MSFPALKESAPSQAEWNRRAKDVVNGLSRALQAAGTTAERPTRNLYAGQTWFDTSLSRPIWWTGSGWIKADGSAA
jgi:hypothetical protein